MAVIVLTLGTFDLFHSGHVALLRRCADLAGPMGRVIVGLNTDDFIVTYKSLPPVITYIDREACIRACRYVDAVVPNDQTDGTARDVIAAVMPDVIAVGWDWKTRPYLRQLGVDEDWLEERRIKIVYLPYTPGAAGPSSSIKRQIWETAVVPESGTETR